jgi:hypothetical protein
VSAERHVALVVMRVQKQLAIVLLVAVTVTAVTGLATVREPLEQLDGEIAGVRALPISRHMQLAFETEFAGRRCDTQAGEHVLDSYARWKREHSVAFSASTESMGRRLVQSIAKRRYSEEDVLRLTLSQLYFGRDGARDIIGVSDAAKTYFDKTPTDMTLSEAALLAAIIGNPNTFSPVRNPDRAAQRRNALLEDMLGCGYVTRDEYLRAIAGAIRVE